jgi:hypothetical protein
MCGYVQPPQMPCGMMLLAVTALNKAHMSETPTARSNAHHRYSLQQVLFTAPYNIKATRHNEHIERQVGDKTAYWKTAYC